MTEKGQPGQEYHNVHKDLIDRCRKGDEKARYEIYRLYYRNMFNASLRILNDTQEAEDVMQESFLAAFEKISTYRGKVSFGAWLKRIVINRSLDALRKRRMIFESADGDSVLELPDEPAGRTEYDSGKLIDAIRRSIHELPDGYRVILSLHLLEGYDHEEVAQILGISESTSRSQYARAKKRLRDIVRKYVERT